MAPFENRIHPPLMIRSVRDVTLRVALITALAMLGCAAMLLGLSRGVALFLLVIAALAGVISLYLVRQPRATLILSAVPLSEGRMSGWIEIESEVVDWELDLQGAVTKVKGARRGNLVVVPVEMLSAGERVSLRARSGAGTQATFSFSVTERR